MIRRGGGRALAAALLLGCVPLPEPPPAPDPRLLRASVGPGLDRLGFELSSDASVRRGVLQQGIPDYVWAPTPAELHLVFLAGDAVWTWLGPSGRRRLAARQQPLPDAFLAAIAPDDAAAVQARREADGPPPRPPDFCAGAPPPALTAACLAEPAVAALAAELRARLFERWNVDALAHGGERLLLRLVVHADGSLAERCIPGATAPALAREALGALEAAFPIPPLRGAAACAAERALVLRIELETD